MNGSNTLSIKAVRGTFNLKEGRESAILALQTFVGARNPQISAKNS
jgi:hypothetical protein